MAAMFIDHYQVLGLSNTCTQEDICKAFKKLALKIHPDKNPENPLANSEFQRLLTAYEVLKDPISRNEFDRQLEFYQQEQQRSFFFKRTATSDQHPKKKSPINRPMNRPMKRSFFVDMKFFDRARKSAAERRRLHEILVKEGFSHIRL